MDMMIIKSRSVADFNNEVPVVFIMADFFHVALLDPHPHPLHNFLALAVTKIAVVSKIAEGHAESFLLKFAVGDLDAVLGDDEGVLEVELDE